MSKPPSIPAATVTKILIRSRRRCCLCVHLEQDGAIKRGQIAHLDHDPYNNREDNLAFLCMPHHNEYDSQASQAKGLTIGEVKHARGALYETLNGNVQTELLQITLNRPFRSFTEAKQRKLLRDIKERLNLGSDIHLIQKGPGSVKLILELSKEDAASLLSAAEAGKLAELGVVDASLLRVRARPRVTRSCRVRVSPARDHHVLRLNTTVSFSEEEVRDLVHNTARIFEFSADGIAHLTVPTGVVVDRTVREKEFTWTTRVPKPLWSVLPKEELISRLEVLLDMHEWRKADETPDGARRIFNIDTEAFPNSATRALDELIRSYRPARLELLRYLARVWAREIHASANQLEERITLYPTDSTYLFRLKKRIDRRLHLLSTIWREANVG